MIKILTLIKKDKNKKEILNIVRVDARPTPTLGMVFL
jgi:hypothetical protein